MQAGQCTADVFAVKLDPTGSRMMYSTYLGGSATAYGFGMAVGASGHMFVSGHTSSADLPATPGAFQNVFAGGGRDVFVTKLNPVGSGASDLLYSTYPGRSGSDQSWAIALDSSGAICLTGSTTSRNVSVTQSAYQSTYSGAGNLSWEMRSLRR
jgi:hypothetical protein